MSDYVVATEAERLALNALVDRVGVGRVVEMLRVHEMAVADVERRGTPEYSGHEDNARRLGECEDRLVYAWVEREYIIRHERFGYLATGYDNAHPYQWVTARTDARTFDTQVAAINALCDKVAGRDGGMDWTAVRIEEANRATV